MLIQAADVAAMPNVSVTEELSASQQSLDTLSGSEKSTGQVTHLATHLVMANTQISQQHSSVLFSAPVELSGCDELELTDNSLPLDEVLNNFELTGGVWEELAIVVSTEVTSDKQKLILLTTKDAVCQIDNVQEESCEALTPELVKPNVQTVLSVIKNYNDKWLTVALSIDGSALSEEDKLHAIRLAKNTLCGF